LFGQQSPFSDIVLRPQQIIPLAREREGNNQPHSQSRPSRVAMRRGRESNPRIDSHEGIELLTQLKIQVRTLLRRANVLTYVLIHGKPRTRFTQAVAVLDLLLHERSWSTAEEINEN
jgi:hypothetical protein